MRQIAIWLLSLCFTVILYSQENPPVRRSKKDTLIILNKDVSIFSSGSYFLVDNSTIHDINLKIQLRNGARFKYFFINGRNITAYGISQCYSANGESLKCYSVLLYEKFVTDEANKITYPKVYLKYLKNKKYYTVEVPLNKITKGKVSNPAGYDPLPKRVHGVQNIQETPPIDTSQIKK